MTSRQKNLLILAIIVVVLILICLFVAFKVAAPGVDSNNSNSSSSASSSLSSSVNSINSEASFSNQSSAKTLTYKFQNYPLSFIYSNNLILTEKSDLTEVNLKYKTGNLWILAEQPGFGFGSAFEITPQEDFVVDGQTVKKNLVANTETGEQSLIMIISYPEEKSLVYGIYVTYTFGNGKIDKEIEGVFDGVVKMLSTSQI